jgi:hypothetical protein
VTGQEAEPSQQIQLKRVPRDSPISCAACTHLPEDPQDTKEYQVIAACSWWLEREDLQRCSPTSVQAIKQAPSIETKMIGTKTSKQHLVETSKLQCHSKQLAMTTRQSYEMKDGSVLETAKHLDVAPENVDYSGATAKTDPKEIALVRKLDWWIMPILWLMYWLNYLVCMVSD